MTKAEPSKWLYEGVPVVAPPEGAIGFVYRIIHTASGRAYIGKKLLWFKGHKQVKGKKKRTIKESDWRTYSGSSVELQGDVDAFGVDAFTFVIERFCMSKGECSYWEAKMQLTEDVLYKPVEFYNSYVGCRIHRKHLKQA